MNLIINKIYFAQLNEQGRMSQIRILGLLNDEGVIKVYFHDTRDFNHQVRKYQELASLGIGETPSEAQENFGKMELKNTRFYRSEKETEKDVIHLSSRYSYNKKYAIPELL